MIRGTVYSFPDCPSLRTRPKQKLVRVSSMDRDGSEVVEREAKWMVRVAKDRQGVLYTWDVLTFAPEAGLVPGLIVWALAHAVIRVMSYVEGSVVLAVGNFLLLVSLVYILVYVGIGYMPSQTQWTESHQRRLVSVCRHLSTLEGLVEGFWDKLKDYRKTSPVKFYSMALAMCVLMGQLGWWLPTSYALHFLVSGCLLVPLALQQHPSGLGQCYSVTSAFMHRIVNALTNVVREVTVTQPR